MRGVKGPLASRFVNQFSLEERAGVDGRRPVPAFKPRFSVVELGEEFGDFNGRSASSRPVPKSPSAQARAGEPEAHGFRDRGCRRVPAHVDRHEVPTREVTLPERGGRCGDEPLVSYFSGPLVIALCFSMTSNNFALMLLTAG